MPILYSDLSCTYGTYKYRHGLLATKSSDVGFVTDLMIMPNANVIVEDAIPATLTNVQ